MAGTEEKQSSLNTGGGIKDVLKLFRISHYMKNILIFTPLFFSNNLFDFINFAIVFFMAVIFCLASSLIYIINDINDVEKDRKHPQKCNRPIACGSISIGTAKIIIMLLSIVILALLSVAVCLNFFDLRAIVLLIIYVLINLGYSKGLKNIPILDIVILAIGYLIRIFYGACIVDVDVSPWLYMTVLTCALYFGMGKRRNELMNSKDKSTRQVLGKYNYAFLDKNMHICAGLSIAFYSLWAIQTEYVGIIWTVFFVIIIFLKYSLDIESEDAEGDPMRVILSDKAIIVLTCSYAFSIFLIIYVL